MKLLLQYIKPYKWLVFLALFLAAVNQSFSMLDPYFFGKLFDKFLLHPYETGYYDSKNNFIVTGKRSSTEFMWGVMAYLGILIGVAMVSRIAKAFQDYFTNVVVQKFGARIFTDGLKHSMKLPYQQFEDQSSGETLSILTKVRTDTEKFIIAFIGVLFSIFVGIVFVSIYAFSLHWAIMPIYAIGIVLLALLTGFLSKKIKVIQKNIVRSTNSLAGSTTESLRNIELVKSLGLTEQEISRLNKNTYKILGLELQKVKSIRSLSFIQGTFVNFLRQVIMFVLLWLVFKGEITPGQVMTLTLYSFFIFGPLQEIGNIILSYREAQASMQNFDDLMKKPVEQKPATPHPVESIYDIAFKNVSFKHLTADYKALDDISFSVEKGETIAFVGPSGSGKSTLVKLLVGLYIPQEGSVYFNNISSHDILFDDLRKKIGFVTQDTQLFAGTIKENLLFVAPDASDEEIIEALYKASCHSILSKANNGIYSVIGEGGLKLSGGEKQRLSIARAMLRHPDLIVFDEATSSLDSLTEEEITATIKKVSKENEQITVLIAHRLSTIMHADRIYVLEKGKIIETGNHHNLLQEKGLYYAMWRQQIGERKINEPQLSRNA